MQHFLYSQYRKDYSPLVSRGARYPIVLAVAMASLWGSHAYGQCAIAELWASDGNVDNYFGWSVAISDDANTLVIGAIGHNVLAGAAYVFVREESGWIEHSILTAPDPVPVSRFGEDVVISADGRTIAVGEPLDESQGLFDAGSALVFEFDDKSSTWVITAKLIASDNVVDLVLGTALTMSASGSTIAITAAGDVINFGDDPSGAVYIFEKPDDGWADMTETAKIVSSDIAPQDDFGSSIAISPNSTILTVGAFLDHNENGFSAGSTYIFERDKNTSKWIEQQKLLASDGIDGDNFGASVAVSYDGQTIIVGARSNDTASLAGSAYVFNRENKIWVEQAKLLASDGAVLHRFGWASEISDDGQTALISNVKGTTYLWKESNGKWNEQAKLTATDPNGGWPGWSIDMTPDATTALLGAKNSPIDGTYNFGSAMVFDLVTPCLGDLDADGSVSTTDLLLLLSAWGPCSVCGNCPADLNGDCTVGVGDLLILLANWG